jgi:hypothetical protein
MKLCPARAVGLSVGLVCALMLVLPVAAQKRPKPIFEQDLRQLGYEYQWDNWKRTGVHYQFTDLAFLSDNLLLLSVREVSDAELNQRPAIEEALARGEMPGSQLSRLILFNIEEKRVVRSARLPVRKMDNAIQAAGSEQFLMLSVFGLHLCSAEFVCGAPRSTDGRITASPRGTRVVLHEYRAMDQLLLDVRSLSVAQTIGRDPEVIPGDRGLLLDNYGKVSARMPGSQDVDLGLESNGVYPEVRFLDETTVIGLKGEKAAVVKVDGTIQFQIAVRDAWRGHTRFVPSASGTTFCIAELDKTGFHPFDIADSRPYNFRRVRVFEVTDGKQLFQIEWDPRDYSGEDILPALSPNGRRLAVVRKGKLQVYEIP